MKNTFLACLLLFTTATFAQNNNTSSPYTRYGYGKLAETGLGAQRGMGGVGYGIRNGKTINPLNPASFSAVDSMTFMLDLGLSGKIGWFKDGDLKGQKINAGLDYLAVQLPLAKGLGLGVGLEPISYVGYQYRDSTNLNNGIIAPETYRGTGGFNNVYTTLSYKFLNCFSAGIKLGYVFGTTNKNGVTYNYDATGTQIGTASPWSDTLQLHGLSYEIGLQYFHKLPNNAELTVGAVYSPKIKLNSTYSIIKLKPGDDAYFHSTDSGFELPETYGLGVSYRQPGGWTVGLDGQYQKWADAQYFSKTDTLQNRMKLNAGAEYAHKLIYRAGLNYADSYFIDKNGSKYKEYGASFGLGIPMVDRRSMINLAFEYSLIRPSLKQSIDEQYFKFTVSYTFNELWFFKRKLQ